MSSRGVPWRDRWVLVVVTALAGVVTMVAGVVAAGNVSAGDGRIRVMTYNIRYASDTAPNNWAQRLPVLTELLRRQRPDLIGVQEAYWRQMRDLDAAFPEYDWTGVGQQGGSTGEFSAIFYRKDRFEILDFGQFWLSDNPRLIGSATWGNRHVRIVTWAKFRDRRTGKEFYQANTHFDHQSEHARLRSARLLLERVREIDLSIPVVVTGDFNAAAAKTPTYSILTSGPGALTDTWQAAERRGAAYNSYGDWRPPVLGGDRIDWILTRGDVRTQRTEIDPYQRNGQYASDHYPVIADILIGRRS